MREILTPDIVHGQAGDLGNLLVAEAFEQQGDDEAVLVRERGDGGAQSGEAFLVFEVLMRAATGSRSSGSGSVGPAFPAIDQRGVHRDAVKPCARARLRREKRAGCSRR